MNAYRRFEAACRAIDLDFHCKATHTEPRFSVTIDPAETSRSSETLAILHLRYRNDDTMMPAVLHHDPDVPGVFFEIVEETVRRELVLELWLPCTKRHRFVAWRNGEAWSLAPLPEDADTATVAEAVALVGAGAGDVV